MDINQVTIVSNPSPDYSEADSIDTNNSEESAVSVDNSIVQSTGNGQDMGMSIDMYA